MSNLINIENLEIVEAAAIKVAVEAMKEKLEEQLSKYPKSHMKEVTETNQRVYSNLLEKITAQLYR